MRLLFYIFFTRTTHVNTRGLSARFIKPVFVGCLTTLFTHHQREALLRRCACGIFSRELSNTKVQFLRLLHRLCVDTKTKKRRGNFNFYFDFSVSFCSGFVLRTADFDNKLVKLRIFSEMFRDLEDKFCLKLKIVIMFKDNFLRVNLSLAGLWRNLMVYHLWLSHKLHKCHTWLSKQLKCKF